MATYYINASANDGDNSWFDTWYYDGLGQTFGQCTGGLRFTGVSIPQGATITAATLKIFGRDSSGSGTLRTKVYGIAEDNTADFTNDPTGRTKTAHSVDWDITDPSLLNDYTSPDISSVVQDIVSRGGWSSGNAMGFLILDDSSDVDPYYSYDTYEMGTPYSEFTVTYSTSASVNVYDSTSVTEDRVVTSGSIQTVTAKARISVVRTATIAAKADIIGEGITPVTRTKTVTAKGRVKIPTYGLSVTKPTYDVTTDTNPSHYVFDSNYGTLKYHSSGSTQLTLDSSIVSARAQIAHGLGYIPFVELYTQAYDGSNTWYYVPFYGYGATTYWEVTYTVDDTYINIYVSSGSFLEEVNFNVKYFIFKNDLQFYQSIYVSDDTTATDVVTI